MKLQKHLNDYNINYTTNNKTSKAKWYIRDFMPPKPDFRNTDEEDDDIDYIIDCMNNFHEEIDVLSDNITELNELVKENSELFDDLEALIQISVYKINDHEKRLDKLESAIKQLISYLECIKGDIYTDLGDVVDILEAMNDEEL